MTKETKNERSATGSAGSGAPLQGLRVLDLTRVLAGPYCTVTLGDLGAEIIKIEEVTKGDDIRATHISERHGISSYFLGINRNKQSVALDIRTPEGREIILELVRKSDVLIENFRAGVMDRNGLGYATISQANPSIIYCAISGYGRDGPDKDRPGYDPVVQGESGLMSLTGEADGDPMRIGVSMIDIITGMFASQAILAALHERKSSGKGQFLEVALFDTAIAMLNNAAYAFLLDGTVMHRNGNTNLAAAPVGVYQAADGPFTLAMTNDNQFDRFCRDVLERPEIAADPQFKDGAARVANRARLETVLGEIFAAGSREQWLARCDKAGIPAGPIRDVAEALTSPEIAGRGLIIEAPHTSAGRVRQLRSPMRFSRTPVVDPVGAPLLGEHTDTVLRGLLDRDGDAINRLRKAGIIR
jgi:crotonobetainyl-CoA:carnitine CoA-transferase CaiB-like acyl-CoA transferase